MASNITIKEIMSKDVKVVREDTHMNEVVAYFRKYDFNSLIVVQGEKPAGIITTKDALVRTVAHAMPLTAMTARQVASIPLVTIDQEATVEEAAEQMRRSHIKHLPVTSEGKLVGIVTDTDIMFAVPSMLSMMQAIYEN
ncbi:MAG: CBS domain-containing protein [Candidatus Bathyarchaeota archaeon]|nr:CBS domain-containing protein [Candidatus Bathyarchaeota archaeon]